MNEIDKKNKILDTINMIRPYIMNDGGNIEFVDYKDGIVYIRVMGSCANCDMIEFTMKNLIETTIKDVVSEVSEIKIV